MTRPNTSMGNKRTLNCNKEIKERIRIAVKVNSEEVFCNHCLMMRAIREHKAKVVVIATRTPPARRAEIERYAKAAKIQIIYYNANYIECANSCGKVFLFSAVAISTQKDAAIIRSLSKKLAAGIALFLDGRDLTY